MEFNNTIYISMKLDPRQSENSASQKEDKSQPCKIIYYDSLIKHKDRGEKTFNFFKGRENEFEDVKKTLKQGFDVLTSKQDDDIYYNDIRKCFEIGCYILYDRQILKEVIEKQKTYETEYIIDFFKYVMRMFFRRYGDSPILSKNQCIDIKNLCKCILGAKNKKYTDMVDGISAKELVNYLQTIVS